MNKNIRQIAIYGKGGIGKSTTSSNISAALSYMNKTVAQIGCDPKADSVNTLMEGNFIPSISENVRDFGSSEETVLNSAKTGFNNILCIESGGPIPGQGCAGRGVLVALELINKYKILDKFNIDFVIYDVLGDIVCGGFAQPVRQGYAEEIYIITSGEYMSLYAANNIATSIQYFANQGLSSRIGGIIGNLKNIPHEKDIIKSFCEMTNIPLLKLIPRSDLVQESEFEGQTVIQSYPDSAQAEVYFELAHKILTNSNKIIPSPLSKENLLNLLKNYKGTNA